MRLSGKPLAIAIMAICLSTLLHGCVVSHRYVFVAPTVEDTNISATTDHHTLYLDLPGLELSVSAGRWWVTNERISPLPLLPLPVVPTQAKKDPTEDPAPFRVEVRLYPWKESTYSFNPMQVVLTTPDGDRLNPKEFIGPVHKNHVPRCDASLSAALPMYHRR